MAEHRARAFATEGKPTSRTAAVVIVLIWVAAVGGAAWLAYRYATAA
jgi:hypothetical protein